MRRSMSRSIRVIFFLAQHRYIIDKVFVLPYRTNAHEEQVLWSNISQFFLHVHSYDKAVQTLRRWYIDAVQEKK